MQELRGALYEPEAWLVWNLDRPTRYCTVISKTWFEARAKGAALLHCSRTDAKLKSDLPLDACCANERRSIDGGCLNCGDPSL
jgi:hypothetical protein